MYNIQGILVVELQWYSRLRDRERWATGARVIYCVELAISLPIFVVDIVRIRASAFG